MIKINFLKQPNKNYSIDNNISLQKILKNIKIFIIQKDT